MPTKFLISIMLLSQNVLCADPDPYVEALHDKTFLKLPNGNEVIISYHSRSEDAHSKIRVFIRNKGKILWDKTFVNEYKELWYQANFIPVIKDQFVEDLNEDGYPEIGIAIWGGGMASWASSAVIFSIKENALEFVRKQQINIEYSRSIYQTKADFNNVKYKCPVCESKEYFYAEDKKAKLEDWPTDL